MIYPKRSEYYEIRTKDHKGGNSARMCEICAISICCVLSAMQEGFDALIVILLSLLSAVILAILSRRNPC